MFSGGNAIEVHRITIIAECGDGFRVSTERPEHEPDE